MVLKDEPGREVVRIGDRVYRPAGPWTPAVQALLRHLEGAGFPYSRGRWAQTPRGARC